jgi:hypothetical protein
MFGVVRIARPRLAIVTEHVPTGKQLEALPAFDR